jgi:tRNA (guanine-N7-)-methyltransferase
MGDVTVHMAQADPATCIVAVDVHTPGIGALLAAAERAGLANVRVCHGDAVELMDHLAPGTLAGIRAYFPDPWPKPRHHKRRLIQPPLVRRAAELIAPGGVLHVATDVADYAQQILAVCSADPAFDCGTGLVSRPVWRPRTRFEARGEAAGRPSFDLIAVRRP